jgi:outer membrane protein
MKSLILTSFLIFGIAFVSMSQKYGFIDSKYIMDQLPEYQENKEKLDKLAERWQKEVDDRYVVLNKRKEALAREEVLLPDDVKEKRKDEIKQLQEEVMQLQRLYFGVNGELFQKRQELIKPIQDKIFDALETIANKGNFTFVFDKANQSHLVYADPKNDLSDKVLKELGVNKKKVN